MGKTEESALAPSKSRGLPALLPLLVFLLGVLFIIFHFDLKPVVGDEGVLAMDAWRITQGQVPQRDFFELIPPLAAYIQAGAFYVLGPSVFSLRLLGALYGVVLLALTWFAGRLYLKEPLFISLPLALLVPMGVGVWPFASHHWLADIFLLAALLVLDAAFSACFTTEAQRLRGGVLAALGGALLALAALTLQDQGGYALIGVCVATLAIPRATRSKVLAGSIAGGGLVGFLVLVPLAIKVGPITLFRDWVLIPLKHYHGAGGNHVTFASGFAQILSQWDAQALRLAPIYATTIGLASMFIYILPFLCLGALLMAWRRKWLPPTSLALLAAMCISFLLAAWHRWSLMNLIWAAPLPVIAVALALERGSESAKKTVANFCRYSAAALLLCLLGFGVLRIMAVKKPGRLYSIVTPAGTYRTFSPIEASEIQGLVDAIAENVPPNEPLFCYGFDPLPNFLTGHANPTRYNFILPGGYTTKSQIEEWKAALLVPKVSWGFGPNLPSEPPEPLETFLCAHYEPVWNNSAYTLWRRRVPPA